MPSLSINAGSLSAMGRWACPEGGVGVEMALNLLSLSATLSTYTRAAVLHKNKKCGGNPEESVDAD